MIGSLAQGLVGVIVDEVAVQGGRRLQQQQNQQQQREGGAHDGQQQPQQQLPPGPLATVVESITAVFNRTLAVVVMALQYLLLLEALLLSAVVIYGALYWLAMPLRLHDKPLYFDYSDRATKGGATGTVDFLAQHTQWEPSPLTKVDRLDTKVLQPGQHYKVSLELQMPTSYTNRRVGVFMVHTTLLDHEDNELASSARPAMLPHTSALRKGIGMVFAWPLHVAGLKDETETVYVDCIDFYKENAAHPLTKAIVTVSSGRVQFYRSSINITPELKGLPWLMRDWFYSTLASGVLFIASLELMLLGFVYVFFYLGLEDPVNSDKTKKAAKNRKDKNDDSRQGAAGTSTTNSYRRGTAFVVREGRDGSGVEHRPDEAGDGRAGPAATAASVAGEGEDFRGEDGLRRRTGAGAAAGSAIVDSTEDRAGVDAPWREASSTSWLGSSFPSQSSSYSPGEMQPPAASAPAATLPPGVKAYQRGSRYVVEGRHPAGNEAGASDGGSSTGGSNDAGGLSGNRINSSGGGAGKESGREDPVPPLLPENATQEELDAAALASWAALDANGGTVRKHAQAAAALVVGGGGMDVDGRGGSAGQRGFRVAAGGNASADQSREKRGDGGVGAADSGDSGSGSMAAVVAAGVGEEGQGGGMGPGGGEKGLVADVAGSSVDVGDDERW